MSKKFRNVIPDFSSRKPQKQKPGTPAAIAPVKGVAPAPRVKPQATSAKSGHRGK